MGTRASRGATLLDSLLGDVVELTLKLDVPGLGLGLHKKLHL